jgi:hypothetical protein
VVAPGCPPPPPRSLFVSAVTVSAAVVVVVVIAAVRILSPLLVIDGDEKNDNELASLDADPDAGTCTGPGGWKWNRRTFPDKLKM